MLRDDDLKSLFQSVQSLMRQLEDLPSNDDHYKVSCRP